MKIGVLFAAALAASALTSEAAVRAETTDGLGVLVTVNDIPITSFDVQQRLALNVILGHGQGSIEDQRKRALQNLIDDQVKLAEAKKLGATPDNKMVDAQIDKMAKGSNTDTKGLGVMLKSKGASMSALRTDTPSSVRRRFSKRTFSENGRRPTSDFSWSRSRPEIP